MNDVKIEASEHFKRRKKFINIALLSFPPPLLPDY